jgi:hypothetical protein
VFLRIGLGSRDMAYLMSLASAKLPGSHGRGYVIRSCLLAVF